MEKHLKRVVLTRLNLYQLEDSIENAIAKLQKLQSDYSKDYKTISLEVETHTYDEVNELLVSGYREETDAEYKKRLASEKLHNKREEDRERAQLKALKKKYETKKKLKI